MFGNDLYKKTPNSSHLVLPCILGDPITSGQLGDHLGIILDPFQMVLDTFWPHCFSNLYTNESWATLKDVN